MAKLTGQFTTPSLDADNNKIHKPLLHAVVFVFTGATKVTRETDAKGKYSFDLANGEYEVSVYLKGNTEKDRFDMRAGEKFTVTATTQADALEKWLQVIGTSGKDELATYYENLLAQMQQMYEDTKAASSEIVGNSIGSGKWIRESAAKASSLTDGGTYFSQSRPVDALKSGDHGLAMASQFLENNPGLDFKGVHTGFIHYYVQANYQNLSTRLVAFFNGYNTNGWYMSVFSNGVWSKPAKFYSTENTTVDSNGFIKAASPIIKLFNDRIEHSGFGANKPVFEKLGVGQYKISNTLGLAQEGWTYEKPRGSDGQPYFRIVVEKLEDGCIVRVHDEYDTVEKAEITDINGNTRTVDKIVKILSQARDIKEHERWIDLRFHEEPEEHQDETLE